MGYEDDGKYTDIIDRIDLGDDDKKYSYLLKASGCICGTCNDRWIDSLHQLQCASCGISMPDGARIAYHGDDGYACASHS